MSRTPSVTLLTHTIIKAVSVCWPLHNLLMQGQDYFGSVRIWDESVDFGKLTRTVLKLAASSSPLTAAESRLR